MISGGLAYLGSQAAGPARRPASALQAAPDVRDTSGSSAGFILAFTALFDAGDQVSLGARPFYRLARNLALVGSLDWIRRGADDASYFGAGDSIPGMASCFTPNAGR